MTQGSLLQAYFRRLEEFSTLRWTGRVTKAVGHLVESDGPFCSVGEGCAILTEGGQAFSGEIVGFRGKTVLSMPLERPSGIRYGDRIVTRGTQPALRVGPDLLGRVIDGSGKPIDGRPNYRAREYRLLHGEAPLPLERAPIREPLGCGIRAIDGLLTCGRGQRGGKEHADRHDDAGHGGGLDGAGSGWGTRPRGARISRGCDWRGGAGAFDGGGFDFGSVAAAADSRGAGRNDGGRILRGAREARAAGG